MANKCATVVVTVKGDIQKVLDEVKQAAAKKNLEIKGDTKKGTIQHKQVDVKGTYSVDGQKISIDITEDSWVVSCAEIEAGLRDFFKGK